MGEVASGASGYPAEREEDVSMQRALRLVVALVVAALMLATMMPAFANGRSESAPNCEDG